MVSEAELAAIDPSKLYLVLDIDDLPGEVWKPIHGYEGKYDVSNLGRVKRIEQDRIIHRHGKPFIQHVEARIMKASLDSDGYCTVTLPKGSNKTKTLHVAREVMRSHCSEIFDETLTVDHIHGVKTDNRLTELQMLSRIDNYKRFCEHPDMVECKKSWIDKLKASHRRENLSEETLQKMRDAGKNMWKCSEYRSKHPNNYTSGRIWIHDDTQYKLIYPDQFDSYTSQGYVKGRR